MHSAVKKKGQSAVINCWVFYGQGPMLCLVGHHGPTVEAPVQVRGALIKAALIEACRCGLSNRHPPVLRRA